MKTGKKTTVRRSISVLLALLAFACAVSAQRRESPRALAEMVAAERAFAKFCTEHGVREAWLEFFADDGVIFHPAPTNAKEFYRPRPPTPKPLPFTLNWAPTYGDTSRAGDLGYTMGPWTAVDNVPPIEPSEHGYFFTVWRRQRDGSWKVALDVGTGSLAGAADPHFLEQPFSPAPHYEAKVPRGADAEAVAAGGPPAGKDALRARIPGGVDVSLALAPAGGGAAKSCDMAYTYGSYELRAGGAAKEKGYYAHMSKRDERGDWKIVVTNFHPEKAQ